MINSKEPYLFPRIVYRVAQPIPMHPDYPKFSGTHRLGMSLGRNSTYGVIFIGLDGVLFRTAAPALTGHRYVKNAKYLRGWGDIAAVADVLMRALSSQRRLEPEVPPFEVVKSLLGAATAASYPPVKRALRSLAEEISLIDIFMAELHDYTHTLPGAFFSVKHREAQLPAAATKKGKRAGKKVSKKPSKKKVIKKKVIKKR